MVCSTQVYVPAVYVPAATESEMQGATLMWQAWATELSTHAVFYKDKAGEAGHHGVHVRTLSVR